MNQTEQNIQIQNLSTEEKKKRQRELTERLNAASRAYYQEAREIMSNYEYDALYDELTALERETGTTLAGSPTVHVGYEVLSELPKERHESPMLSLDKTKDRRRLLHGSAITVPFFPGNWMV